MEQRGVIRPRGVCDGGSLWARRWWARWVAIHPLLKAHNLYFLPVVSIMVRKNNGYNNKKLSYSKSLFVL